ncbi:hypothetical protein DL546_007658 [Coniochaeta pulveracea]|uniref:RRM domain-containing protein n=1 Tax=Coniochaeta pulveracea TaxID=177199 RepID=A0A420YJT7_9PEZI|nr:hypothetical protein DL546_007658 [Coniochaeta pulveracea]
MLAYSGHCVSLTPNSDNLRRNLVRGGVEDATIDLLCKDDADIEASGAEPSDQTPTSTKYVGVPSTTHRATITAEHSQPQANGNSNSFNHNPGIYGTGSGGVCHGQPAWADYEPEDGEYLDEATIAGGPVGANYYEPKQAQVSEYVQKCTRTVLIQNLPQGTTHADVTDAVRGGLLLDIFLRTHDRACSVSFLHAADARYFYDYARKHDLYINNKRVTVKWDERQFTLAGHAIGKLNGGATRNFILKGIDPHRHTEETIREDLDHIHNLAVLKVHFRDGNCYIKTNSVNYAQFARTCMMSRGKYRSVKMQWDVDECAQPYELQPIPQVRSVREPLAKKVSNNVNRFQLLHLDDEEEEQDELPAPMETKYAAGITAL